MPAGGSITSITVATSKERKLFSLPARMGGLGIDIPSEICLVQYENSKLITAQLVEQIKLQSPCSTINSQILNTARREVMQDKKTKNS